MWNRSRKLTANLFTYHGLHDGTYAQREIADTSLMARAKSSLMTHRVVRFLAVFMTATAVVVAGITLNLGILSNDRWGPGGLTLGAAGVVKTDDTAPINPRGSDSPSTTRRRISASTTTVLAPSESTNGDGSKPFQPSSRPSSAPTEATQPSGVTSTSAAPEVTTTTKRKPTTTTTDLGDPQQFRVATWAIATVRFTSPSKLRVTTSLKRGWTVDEPVRTGDDITMEFRNGPVEVTFRVWINDGEIESTSKRVKHDS